MCIDEDPNKTRLFWCVFKTFHVELEIYYSSWKSASFKTIPHWGYSSQDQWADLANVHRKTQVNHLTHLSHSGSVHGQNDSKMCEKWIFLSV